MLVQICCREKERRLGGGEGSNSGMCVAGCWIGVSCEEETRFYFDLGGEGSNFGLCVVGCWIGVSCEEEMRFYLDLNDRN